MGKVIRAARLAESRILLEPLRPRQAEPQAQALDAQDSPAPSVEIAPAGVAGNLEIVELEAQRVVDAASAQAERLVNDALSRCVEIGGRAREGGHREGLAAGRMAARAEMEEALVALRGVIEALRSERRRFIEAAEPELVRLATVIAERVVHRQLALETGSVVEMARSAIVRLVSRERVTIRVNPADLEAMREYRDRLIAQSEIEQLCVIEDQRVDRGGVVLETDAGTIDGKVSTQLREARRLLAVDEAHPFDAQQAG